MNKVKNTALFIASVENKHSCRLTLQKMAFMSLLWDGAKTTKEICTSMGVTQSTASTSMEGLRGAGLVEHTSDAYASPYRLTAEGIDLLRELQFAMHGQKKYEPSPKGKVRYTKTINARTVPLRSVPDVVTHKVHGPAPHTRTWGW